MPEWRVDACYTRGLTMPSRYAQWMYDWEHRLTSVDNNRVVRPLDWGVEFTRDWPCRNGYRLGHAPDDPEKFILDYNHRIVAASDEFYSYTKPTDFCVETREVQVFSTREVPIHDPARIGLGYIQPIIIGRKRDPIRRPASGNFLFYRASVGMGIVDAGDVTIRRSLLTPIREPEITILVEYEIIGAAKPASVATRVERGEGAVFEIHALDRARGVIRGLSKRYQHRQSRGCAGKLDRKRAVPRK